MSVLAAVLAAGLAAEIDAPAGAVLTRLRQESLGPTFRLVVELDTPAEFSYQSPEPALVRIDFPGVGAGSLPARVVPERPEIASIGLSPLPGGRPGTRLEVRLAAFVPYRVVSEGRSVMLILEPAAAPAAAPRPVPTVVASPRAAPAPAAAPAPRSGAGRVLSLAWSTRGPERALSVQTDGPLRYRDFVLAHPDRLVVDFPGATFVPRARFLPSGGAPVRRVRVGHYGEGEDGVARLVVDLSAPTPYHIVAGEAGVTILFGAAR